MIRFLPTAFCLLVLAAFAGLAVLLAPWVDVGVPTDEARRPAQPSGNVPGTVVAGFGKTEPFESFESAERRLGWRFLRPGDPRFDLVRQGGLLVTLPEVGLPHLDQSYAMEGRDGLIGIIQGPEGYDFRKPERLPVRAIGRFVGEWWADELAFYFYSGESADGKRIRVAVYPLGDSFSDEDVVDFVASLNFTSIPCCGY
jgi:hypothetical protein